MKILALILSTALAAQVQEEPWTEKAASGVNTQILNLINWYENCTPLPMINEITQHPAHGKVSEKIGTIVLGEQHREELVSGDYGNCRGKEILSKVFWYQSERGFTGVDQFKFTSTWENGKVINYTVDVIVN